MTNKLSLRVVLVSVALVLLAGAVGSALLPHTGAAAQEKELQGSMNVSGRAVVTGTPISPTSPLGLKPGMSPHSKQQEKMRS